MFYRLRTADGFYFEVAANEPLEPGVIEVPKRPNVHHRFVVEDTEWVPEPNMDVIAFERANTVLTRAQMLMGLVSEGWITEAEGNAWLARTALPAVAIDLINTFPEAERFGLRARLMDFDRAPRDSDLVIGLGSAAGKTESDIDAFFEAYSGR